MGVWRCPKFEPIRARSSCTGMPMSCAGRGRPLRRPVVVTTSTGRPASCSTNVVRPRVARDTARSSAGSVRARVHAPGAAGRDGLHRSLQRVGRPEGVREVGCDAHPPTVGDVVGPRLLTTYNQLVVCWSCDREQRGPGGRPVPRALRPHPARHPAPRAGRGALGHGPGGEYDMSFAAVQKHVAVLERAGLLNKRRSGREQLASGDVEAVRSVASMLDELESVWRGRVARIDDTTHARRTDMPVTDITKDVDARTLDHHGGVRRTGRAGLGAVCRPAPARAGLGPAGVPGDLRRPRAAPGRPDDLLHDLTRGREVRRLLGHQGGRRAAAASPSDDGFADDDLQPNPDLPVVAERLHLQPRRRWHPGRVHAAPTTPPRRCRRCSTWASRRAPRSAINQIDGFLANNTQNA